tara:strand:+ start:423 stop:830 length:408 start_codon:yes stop_codon:yes gene_type:complete
MKDCTRLDVVTANLSADPKKDALKKKIDNTGHEYWEKLKTEMNNDAWNVLNSSLVANEALDGCSLDVSITYERKLRRYVKNIDFTYPSSEKKVPAELTDNLINELNNLASLASGLAKKLSQSDENLQTEDINYGE